MKVVNLGENNTILNTFVAQIRDIHIQKDRLRFRTNLERLGQIFGYEISKELSYSKKEVITPLGSAEMSTYDNKVVVATILRAGLPLYKGILDYFDDAENGFVAAYRKYSKSGDFHINTEYCTCPNLTGKTLILADTMVATGASVEVAFNKLCEESKPEYIHLVCPIVSEYAVDYLQQKLPANTTLWTAAIDEELTNQSFIVPGLGDAGDLAFGEKL